MNKFYNGKSSKIFVWFLSKSTIVGYPTIIRKLKKQ